ncbi:MAG: DUF3857 domain-containing protein, partial [Acidobacteriota bacterium]
MALWALGLFVGLSAGFAGSTGADEPEVTDSYRFETLGNSYRFAADGSSTVRVDAEIRVLGSAAIQQLGQLYFPYAGDISRLEVHYIRVVKPDGRELEASRDLFKDLDAPVPGGFPIYSNLRLLHVTAPPFEVGDRLHYLVDVHFDPLEVPGPLSVLHDFERTGVDREVLTVDIPTEIEVVHRSLFEPQIEDLESHRRYTWIFEASGDEPAPGDGADGADGGLEAREAVDVELSTAKSWAEVGAWFRSLAEGRDAPGPELRRLVEERLEGVEDPRGKIEVLHRLVTTEIRYLSLLLERGRYLPRFAQEVLESGFGDCKDKHALLSALLRAAGFETAGVLVNLSQPPALGVPTQLHFNHIITRVELEDGPVWLDSTAVAPAGYLAPALRGARGLLVPATGEPRLVEMPEELLSGSSLALTRTARVDDDGTLNGDDVLRVRGDYEVLTRAAMLTMDSDQWRQMAPAFAGG